MDSIQSTTKCLPIIYTHIMLATQKRYISFKSVGSMFSRLTGRSGSSGSDPKTNEITEPMNQMPTSTGAGAFTAPISFEILGSFANLLSVKLPASSILNLRYNNKNQSVVAMNGSISNLYVELGKLSSQKQREHLVFQRCFNSESAMTILLSTKAQNSNFSVVNLKDNATYKWIISNKESLVAWSGNYLNISLPFATRPLLFSSSKGKTTEGLYLPSALEATGEGSFVLSSPGQVLQIQLEKDEKISIAPSSVIAYTVEKNSLIEETSKETLRSIVDISVPTFSLWKRFTTYANRSYKYTKQKIIELSRPQSESNSSSTPKLIEDKASTAAITEHVAYIKTMQYLTAARNGVAKQFKKLYAGADDVMIELSGPKTILINNFAIPPPKFLTEKQLERLYK